MLKKLNNYHPKIKLTIEFNPPKFLDTEIIILNNEVITLYIEKKVNYLFLGNLKFLSITNVTLYYVNLTVLIRYPQIFLKKLKIAKKKSKKSKFSTEIHQ